MAGVGWPGWVKYVRFVSPGLIMFRILFQHVLIKGVPVPGSVPVPVGI